jgi:hypothetical protein
MGDNAAIQRESGGKALEVRTVRSPQSLSSKAPTRAQPAPSPLKGQAFLVIEENRL